MNWRDLCELAGSGTAGAWLVRQWHINGRHRRLGFVRQRRDGNGAARTVGRLWRNRRLATDAPPASGAAIAVRWPSPIDRSNVGLGAGSRLDEARFAAYFFGRSGSDPVPAQLHAIAIRLGLSGSQTTLANAAASLADVMQTVGLDRWQAFLADASARTDATATRAAIAVLDQPKPAAPDAITPVYPVEAGIAVIGAGLAGGAAAIGRMVGSAVLRRFVPKPQAVEAETAADILMPGGKPVGSKGSIDQIRELSGGLVDAQRLFAKLTKGATNVTTVRDKGVRMQTANGGFITLRQSSKSGPPTIDIKQPGIPIRKLKFLGD